MQRNILEYLEHTVCWVPEKIALSKQILQKSLRAVYYIAFYGIHICLIPP